MQYDHLLRESDVCYLLKNEIAPLLDLADFSKMQKSRGRLQICPKTLTLITLLQFIEGLSDRACILNLRFRLDWKIALGLEVDDEGFHHSTLSNFRNRLIECESAGYAFDKVLELLVSRKLVKSGQKQRVDSTHVLGLVADLSRIELMHETLRLFFKQVDNSRTMLPIELEPLAAYYSSDIGTRGISNEQRAKFLTEAGETMASIVRLATEDEFSELKILTSYETLRTVFEQNFIANKDEEKTMVELIPIATGKGHICSPHEPEARRANKGGKGWTGYKAQVAETIPDEENKGFITYAEATESTEYDGRTVAPLLEEMTQNNIDPSEVFADTHYNTASNIENSKQEGIELKGPVAPNTKKTKEENKGISFDFNASTATCQKGVEVGLESRGKDDRLKASFPAEDCNACLFADSCKPQPKGKKIQTKRPNPTLERRRADMEQPDFKELNQNPRNGVEGTISGLVRGQKLRNARYRGLEKVKLQVKFSAAAANTIRLAKLVA